MDLDALVESARNRGLKLVRSRVRTPGKQGFGKVGITDAAGKPLFGFHGKNLAATPEEAENYLRGLGSSDWGASVVVTASSPRTSATRKRASENPLPRPATKLKAKPKLPPKPEVRLAKPKDAADILPLLGLLGYSLDERGFAKRLRQMIGTECSPLVAVIGTRIVGLCGVQISTMLQREQPVGRITVLVIAEDQRRKAIGRMLLDAAEAQLRSRGCELVEVTSNDKHLGAHAFYRRVGFERTSIRFAKSL